MTKISTHFRLLFLYALLLFSVTICCAKDEGRKVDQYMHAITSQGRFSGVVLVARGGKVLLSKGYGFANREWNIPNSPKTIFRIGSLTKQFTAVAILQLQMSGKLHVQDTLSQYIPDCPEVWKTITIHQLLTQTSGIPNLTSFPEYEQTTMIPTTIEQLIARFKDKPLDFKPGEGWNYSNSNYILLGYIIENVSGQSYAQFLNEHIFMPLQMTDTGYDSNQQVLPFRATGYAYLDDDTVVNAKYVDMSIPSAAGALHSTVGDLFWWENALFGGKVLTKPLLDAMLTPVSQNYAYGIYVSRLYNRRVVSHPGVINGFTSYLVHFPDDNITIIVLKNAGFGDPDVVGIGHALSAIIFDQPYTIPQAYPVFHANPTLYRAYVGQYALAPQYLLKVTQEGDSLFLECNGQKKFRLYPESTTDFYMKALGDVKLTFVKDAAGQVTGVIVHHIALIRGSNGQVTGFYAFHDNDVPAQKAQ